MLAAVRLVEESMLPSALFLAYPNADMTLSQPSISEKGQGWGLDEPDLAWFIEQWVPAPGDRAHPLNSPLHATVDGLPPVVLITAEHDPLRDEGELLAKKLRRAGVRVQHHQECGLVHGFFGLTHISPAAARATDRAFERFGTLLRGVSSECRP